MSTHFPRRNTDITAISFLTKGASENSTESCGAAYTDGTFSMIKSDLYHLHRHYIKPLTDVLRKQQDRPQTSDDRVISYVKSLLMFDHSIPRAAGKRDIMYHLHSAERLNDDVKSKLLGPVYDSIPKRPRPKIYRQNKVLLSRGPCKFPQQKFISYNFKDPVGRFAFSGTTRNSDYTYRAEEENVRQQIKLPAHLHKLLEHAVHWGATKARDTKLNPDHITKMFKHGFIDSQTNVRRRWSPHNHAALFFMRMAKTLNVGNLPRRVGLHTALHRASDQDIDEATSELWSLIQSHTWTGHKCLLSQYRRNFSKGFTKGLEKGRLGGGRMSHVIEGIDPTSDAARVSPPPPDRLSVAPRGRGGSSRADNQSNNDSEDIVPSRPRFAVVRARTSPLQTHQRAKQSQVQTRQQRARNASRR